MIAVSQNVGGGFPYQTGKTVHVHAKNEDRRIAPGVRGHGSIPHTHTLKKHTAHSCMGFNLL